MATQVKTGLIANDAITDAKIANVALTGVTASSGDSSTSLATTAFVAGEINSLIDSAPGALNTLNELAAALGDDANFSTTVTNSIATKLPLAGGTLTGNLIISKSGDLHNRFTSTAGDSKLTIESADSKDAWINLSGATNEMSIGYERTSSEFRVSNSDTLASNVRLAISSSTGNATFSGNITSGSHLINASSSAFGGSSVQGFNTDFLVDTGQGYSRHNSYHTGGSNHQFLVNATGSTTNTVAFELNKDAHATFASRIYPGEHVIFQSSTGYLQFPGASSRAWAMASSGGTAAPGTQSATFGFHHWSGSAWSNPINITASGKLGIGTDNPDNTLHILKASAGSVQGNTNSPLTVENDTNNYIQVLAPDSSESGILFGNPTNVASVGIVAHGTAGAGGMDFRVGGNQTYMQLKSDGYLEIHNNRGEYGLELRSASSRSGLVIKKPGTSSIDGSALVLSDGTYRLGTANDYHMYMYSSGNTAGVTAGYNVIGPDADQLTGMGITPTHGKLEVQGSAHDATLIVSNDDLSGSANSIGFDGRGGRYLTSNGTSWDSDGKDPGLVIGSNHTSANTRKNLGIVLHNESNADNVMSPGIFFGSKSASGSYNTAYAYIMGKTKTSGADTNWKTGEIHMDTAGQHSGLGGSATYFGDNPAFRMSQGGVLHFPNQAHAYGHFTSNNTSLATGWGMTVESSQGVTYTNHSSHGNGITVIEEGYYGMWATGLYQYSGSPGTYVYVGWAINGAQHHHWHSNHTLENNHDFVSLVFGYLSAGDHITMENTSAGMASQWGGNHSFFSIWKVG